MVKLREALDILLHCNAHNLIDCEGLILSYDVNEPANPEFLYWTYLPFDLDKFSDNKCNAELGFLKTPYTA